MRTSPSPTRLVDQAWVNKLLILFVAIMWGFSFTTMKGLVTEMPVFHLLAYRNALAAAIMLLWVRGRIVRALDRATVALGAAMGLTGFAAYATQTIGLSLTTPGKNAFLTGCYCVMVPFLSWAFGQGRPGLRHVLAAAVCACGIGLVSVDSGLTPSAGDMLSLSCGIFYALQFVILSKWGQGSDSWVITTWEFVIIAVCSGACAAIAERDYVTPVPTASDFATMLYLALVCSCLCFGLLNRAMTLVDPAEGSILSALEAPFGVLSSIIVYHEQVTTRLFAGFSLIFVAIVMSEAGDDLLRRWRTRRGAGTARERV